jgi:hypothetical protein
MASAKAIRGNPICDLGTQTVRRPALLRTIVLHRESSLETQRVLRDFGYDAQLLKDDQVDEKSLSNLRGVVRTSCVTMNGRSYQNLDAFAPEADWELFDCTSLTQSDVRGGSDGL